MCLTIRKTYRLTYLTEPYMNPRFLPEPNPKPLGSGSQLVIDTINKVIINLQTDCKV